MRPGEHTSDGDWRENTALVQNNRAHASIFSISYIPYLKTAVGEKPITQQSLVIISETIQKHETKSDADLVIGATEKRISHINQLVNR